MYIAVALVTDFWPTFRGEVPAVLPADEVGDGHLNTGACLELPGFALSTAYGGFHKGDI